MPRAKKSDVSSEAAILSADTAPAVSSSSSEKKPRKANQWNTYFKEEYPKFKGAEEHKSKSHSELTKIISSEYKKKKEQAPTAEQ